MTGKAQRAVAALDYWLGLDYDSLRKAVLEAYGSVPEAYRLRFRELRRQPGETYLDFWRNQEMAIDRWRNSWEAFDYSELRALWWTLWSHGIRLTQHWSWNRPVIKIIIIYSAQKTECNIQRFIFSVC